MRTIYTQQEFLDVVREADEQLKKENVPITARSIQAWLRISALVGGGLPLAGKAIPGVFRGASLSGHISDWYDATYGDRQKVDFLPASVVLLLRGDPFLARLPLVFGTVVPLVDKSKRAKQ